jgi:hypothetical protein
MGKAFSTYGGEEFHGVVFYQFLYTTEIYINYKFTFM